MQTVFDKQDLFLAQMRKDYALGKSLIKISSNPISTGKVEGH